MRWTHY